MLGTLLDKLQSLFSRNFAIGSIPLLAFLFLNGLMAFRVSYYFQRWVQAYFLSKDLSRQAVISFALLVMVVIVSYVVSTLGVFMRETLEGKHGLGKFFSDALSQRYRDRLFQVERDLREARTKRRKLREKQDLWTREMGEAYQLGARMLACIYPGRPELVTLSDRLKGNQELTVTDLEPEVQSLTTTLRANNPELDTPPSKLLDRDHGTLLQLIRYATDRAQENYAQSLTEFQFDYAGEDVAPTKMGNISRVAPHYAASRYSMNLDIFWTRLQKVVATDTNFYSVVQDAKMQVDFLVALIWYTLLFTLVWVIALPCMGEARNLFLGIAIAGPLLAYVWYRVALQNYRAFANLLCASVDLFRMDLLKAFRIPLPANAEQERLVWETIEQRLVYGDHSNITLQVT
jgi:hypothetical protein